MQKNSPKVDLKKKFFKYLSSLWPLFVLLITTLIFFYPVFQGKIPLPADFTVGVYFPWLDYKWGYSVGVPVKNPMTTDVVSFIYPMQMLAIDLLKSGEWPLWNPYILAGTPLLANFQSAAFSPTNFVYFLFDKFTAWSLQIMLQHFLAAIFTYLLLRHWNVSKIASLLGGVVFAFSGFNLLWSQWNGHALAAAFIPLILFFEDKFLNTKKIIFGLGFSLAVCFQILSGYPQVVMYTALPVVLLWAFRVWRNPGRISSTLILGGFGILGLGLSALQLFSGAELLSLSQREVEPHPYEWAFLPWIKIITFFAPDYFGNHSTDNWWGPQDYTSNTGFVGTVAFILATIGATNLKNRNIWFSFLLLVVSLILSFPTPLSLFLWKSGILGLQAASAHRALVLFDFSIALLVGFGVDKFLKTKKFKTTPFFVFPTVVIIFFAGAAVLSYLHGGIEKTPNQWGWLAHAKEDFRVALKNLIPTSVVLVVSFFVFKFVAFKPFLRFFGVLTLGTLLTFDLFRFGWKFNPFSPRHIVFPETPVLTFLKNQEKPFRTTGSRVISINMRMPYKIETIEGYDAVYPLHISQFIAAITSGKSGTQPVGRYGIIGDETARVLSLINVKYNLALKRDERNNPSPEGEISPVLVRENYPIAFEDRSVAILENKDVLPRAFMVYDWDVSSGPETLDKYLDKDFPIDKKILLETDPKIPSSSIDNVKSSVQYLEYKEQKSVIAIETDKPGFLFVSDTWYPGWKAFVNDKETEIHRANFAFRAIYIPEGQHTVKIIYQPESFFNGLAISIFSALVLIFIYLFQRLWENTQAKS